MDNQVLQKIHHSISLMIEDVFTYVGKNFGEVELILLFGYHDDGAFYYSFSFVVNGSIAERHKVNEYLDSKCDASTNKQSETLNLGIHQFEYIINAFREAQKQPPYSMKIIYEVGTEDLQTNFGYQNLFGDAPDLI